MNACRLLHIHGHFDSSWQIACQSKLCHNVQAIVLALIREKHAQLLVHFSGTLSLAVNVHWWARKP